MTDEHLLPVNADWYKGHLESNPSKIGFFPSNYVRKEPGGSVSTAASQRFVAPPSQQQQQHSFPQPAGQNPNPHGYQQPYNQLGYNPYPNQQYQASHASILPPHASNDPSALAPVPYAPGPVTTAVTPGGTHAVVTNNDTGKKNRFALKPGSMKSTVSMVLQAYLSFGFAADCFCALACAQRRWRCRFRRRRQHCKPDIQLRGPGLMGPLFLQLQRVSALYA